MQFSPSLDWPPSFYYFVLRTKAKNPQNEVVICLLYSPIPSPLHGTFLCSLPPLSFSYVGVTVT